MSKTVTGLFSTMAQAQQAKQALVSQGFSASEIDVVADNRGGSLTGQTTTTGTASSTASSTGASGVAGIGEKVGSYLRNLTGGDETAHEQYRSGIQSGGAIISVNTSDDMVSQAVSVLRQAGAQDLGGATGQTTSGTMANTAATSANVTGDTMIPVVEEQLVVGKRVVDHGGVRVFSHVVERPVDAEVVLREERIVVDRHPVSRAATEADFQTGNAGAIELKAMAEEAVVGKTSRVVEEVRVGKTSSEHAETIHDSVRKTEVDVEQVATETARTGTGLTSDPTAATFRK